MHLFLNFHFPICLSSQIRSFYPSDTHFSTHTVILLHSLWAVYSKASYLPTALGANGQTFIVCSICGGMACTQFESLLISPKNPYWNNASNYKHLLLQTCLKIFAFIKCFFHFTCISHLHYIYIYNHWLFPKKIGEMRRKLKITTKRPFDFMVVKSSLWEQLWLEDK